MAKCALCGKHSVAGRSISHSHKVNKRWFKANLHKIRAKIDGKITQVYVCTKCLRRVEKVV